MAVGNLLFAYDPTNDTPETVQKKRAMIAQLMATNQRPRNVGEGVGAMMTGLAAGIMNHRATKAERTGRENATKTIANLLSGIGGSDGPSGGMVAPQPSQQSAPQAFAPSAPVERQPLDMPSQRVAQAHAGTGDTGQSWLRYANESAVRSLPLNDKLTSALSFLPDLGVEMEVFSGGQPAKGLARIGSTRHDHGNAADVFFYKDGRRLDWANPDDLPIFEEIVRRGRAAGITGFGAGEGYMRPGSMHIGFGNEAVWGAGGKGENAPEWLRNAFNSPLEAPATSAQQAVAQAMQGGGAPAGLPQSAAPGTIMRAQDGQTYQYAETTGMAGASGGQGWIRVNAGGGTPVQMAQAQPQTMNDAGGPSMQQLLEAAQNPWLSDSQRSIVNTLLEQRMQAQDPMRQMQMEKARLELDQMRNPQQSLINAGDGRIYDPNSQQWITAPNAGQGFRKATPEEAAQYGAAGGQFGPDGRFYPINPPSGTALSVDPTTGAVSFQQGSGVKPLTEGQSKDAVYATRAEGSLGTLDQFGDALTNPLGHAAEKDPTGLIRRQQSPEFQQAQQAGREFLQAILRKDTGAAITTDEMDSYGRTYLPMPGDGPELLRQKQIARKRALEALKAGMPPQAILQQEKALANVDESTAQEPQQDAEGWREIAPGVRVKRVD